MRCGAERLGLFSSRSFGVEQSGVLDRDRRLGGECRRDVCKLFVVDVGLELVDAEDADNAVADDHRRADPTADARAAADVTREMRVVGDVGENLRPLRPHDVAVEVGLVVEVEAPSEESLRIVEATPADDYQTVSLDHLDGAAVIRDDALQLVEDRLDRLLQAQHLPQHLRHGEERLGVLACTLDLADVVVDGEEAGVLAVHHEGGKHQLDVDRGAVLPRPSGDPLCTTGGHGLARDLAPLVTTRIAEHEVVDRAAERLLGGVAEQLGRRRIPLGDPLVGVHDDHRHRVVLDEGLELGQPPTRFGELR